MEEVLKEIESKYKTLINHARDELRTEGDFHRRIELNSYIRGLEEALKIVNGYLYKKE